MTTLQGFQDSLSSKIKYPRANTLWNHILTIVRLDSDGLSGNVTDTGFKLWTYSRWVGIFHPVIHGEFHSVAGKISVRVQSKINPLARVALIVFLAWWAYGVVPGTFVKQSDSWTMLWNNAFAAILMLGLPAIVLGLAFRFEYKHHREKIRELCENHLHKQATE